MLYRQLFKFSTTFLLIFVGLIASQNTVKAELAEESLGEAAKENYISYHPACNTAGRATPIGKNLGDTLRSGQKIHEGDYLRSKDGRFKLLMQGDGNLVIYGVNKVVWSSGTHGQGCTPFKLILRKNGNLIIRDKDSRIWASDTSGKGSHPVSLVMQNDGNLVMSDQSSLNLLDLLYE